MRGLKVLAIVLILSFAVAAAAWAGVADHNWPIGHSPAAKATTQPTASKVATALATASQVANAGAADRLRTQQRNQVRLAAINGSCLRSGEATRTQLKSQGRTRMCTQSCDQTQQRSRTQSQTTTPAQQLCSGNAASGGSGSASGAGTATQERTRTQTGTGQSSPSGKAGSSLQ